MIVEHALLPVRPGAGAAFEAAFAQAYPIIASMPGFGGLSLSRCVERPGCFLLLVRWEQLTDHTVGFRESPEYQRWRALLHHFYEPFPVVEHFAPVLGDEVFPVAASLPADT
ncbi:antibiotic biosynthesis monooxygenase family protein [Nocardia fluminea]|uniref:Heme-degrading monooxygenase HmoA n=1 Tax=Nocardia fluminea TaxID=134984 RepID=A0A2N3WZ16_9NOCA|nr:antibiotic biosynthesis monooxygenase [Nocardia fluminea]PKV99088.1 heme-degrading monooxygenase HmoA [Nocardia fluminea]